MRAVTSTLKQAFESSFKDVSIKAEVYDTKLTTPTKGIQFTVNSGSETLLSGVVPNLSFYWGGSSPFFLPAKSDYNITFYGKFYAERSGALTFFIAGECDVSFDFNGAAILSNTSIALSDYSYTQTSVVNVTAGTWYDFSINIYYSPFNHKYGGIVVKYDIESDQSLLNSDKSIVVNSGVVNDSPSFISPMTLKVSDVNITQTINDSSKATIVLPFGDSGYKIDPNDNNVIIDSSDPNVKIGIKTLTKVYVGAQTSGGIEYIPVITGNVEKIIIDRDENLIKLEIGDFWNILERAINRNYPDPSSYWNFGYFNRNSAREPNGVDMPIAYDKFRINHAIEDLFIKAGVSANHFHGKIPMINSSYNKLYINGMFENDYLLDFADDYFQISENTNFAHKLSFGDKLIDVVNRILESYGYNGFFDGDGTFVLDPQASPYKILLSSDLGGTQDVSSIKAFSGEYKSGTVTAPGVMCRSFAAIIKREVSGSQFTINVYSSDQNGAKGVLLSTYTYDTTYSSDWEFRDGIDSSTGENPTIFKVVDLQNWFDYYYIEITGAKVDALFLYKNNIDSPTYWLYTSRDISKLNYSYGINKLRNDVVVIGQRKGVWINDSIKPISSVNDDKPNWIYSNVFYRSVNSRSMYDPTYSKWVAETSTIVVQTPDVATSRRAKDLSIEVLNALSGFNDTPSIRIAGNMNVEPGEFVRIYDEKGKTFDVLVKSLSIEYDDGILYVSIEAFPFKPLYSYIDPPPIPGDPIVNIAITDSRGNLRSGNRNSISKTTSTVDLNTSTSIAVENTNHFSESGILIITENGRWASVSYSSKDDKNFYGISLIDTNNTTNKTYSSGAVVYEGYNPFESDEGQSKNLIKLSFQVNANCSVRAGVKSKLMDDENDSFIASLTGGGGFESSDNKNIDGLPGMERYFPGDNVELYWDGVDEKGLSHSGNEELEGVRGFYASPGEYYIQIIVYNYDTGETSVYSLRDKSIYVRPSDPGTVDVSVVHANSVRDTSVYFENNNAIGGKERVINNDILTYFIDEGGISLSFQNNQNSRKFRLSLKVSIYDYSFRTFTIRGTYSRTELHDKDSSQTDEFFPNGKSFIDVNNLNINVDVRDSMFGNLSLSPFVDKTISDYHNDTSSYTQYYSLIRLMYIDINIVDKAGRKNKINVLNSQDFGIWGSNKGMAMYVYPGQSDGSAHDTSSYNTTKGTNNYSLSYLAPNTYAVDNIVFVGKTFPLWKINKS